MSCCSAALESCHGLCKKVWHEDLRAFYCTDCLRVSNLTIGGDGEASVLYSVQGEDVAQGRSTW